MNSIINKRFIQQFAFSFLKKTRFLTSFLLTLGMSWKVLYATIMGIFGISFKNSEGEKKRMHGFEPKVLLSGAKADNLSVKKQGNPVANGNGIFKKITIFLLNLIIRFQKLFSLILFYGKMYSKWKVYGQIISICTDKQVFAIWHCLGNGCVAVTKSKMWYMNKTYTLIIKPD